VGSEGGKKENSSFKYIRDSFVKCTERYLDSRDVPGSITFYVSGAIGAESWPNNADSFMNDTTEQRGVSVKGLGR